MVFLALKYAFIIFTLQTQKKSHLCVYPTEILRQCRLHNCAICLLYGQCTDQSQCNPGLGSPLTCWQLCECCVSLDGLPGLQICESAYKYSCSELSGTVQKIFVLSKWVTFGRNLLTKLQGLIPSFKLPKDFKAFLKIISPLYFFPQAPGAGCRGMLSLSYILQPMLYFILRHSCYISQAILGLANLPQSPQQLVNTSLTTAPSLTGFLKQC